MSFLEIRPDNHHEFKGFINGIDCFKLLPFSERVRLWEGAIHLLENDVQQVADFGKDVLGGEFFWCFTWENHRNDGVLGTIYYYYLLEVIKELDKQNPISSIQVHASLPVSIQSCLKAYFPSIKHVRKGFFSQPHINQIFRPYLGAGRSLVLLIAGKFKHPRWKLKQDGGKVILLQSGSRFSYERFHHFLPIVRNVPIMLFHGNMFEHVKTYPSTFSQLYIPSFLGWSSILESIKGAFQNSIKLRQANALLQNGIFYNRIVKQSILQFFVLNLKAILFRKALIELQPQLVAVTSSLSDPNSRLPLSVAHRLKVPSFMIACRSMVSEFRPEDRACIADINGYNSTSMSDYFVVRDEFSKRTWVAQGIDEERIGLQYSGEEFREKAPVLKIEAGLVLLFTQYDSNTEICRLISQVKLDKFQKIYIRNHPNRRKRNEVSQQQMLLLSKTGLPVQDISDVPMSAIKCSHSLAIVVNSTAGIEIVSTGCGVVWLPFISEHSLQFFDAMKLLGKVCNREEEFTDFIEREVDDLVKIEKMIIQCIESYRRYFTPQEDDRVLKWVQNIVNDRHE